MDALLSKPYSLNSNCGNKKFFHDGRLYFKHRLLRGVNEGKVSTQCDRKLKGCKGRAWFFEDGRFFKIVTGHGCDSDPSHIAATAIRNEEKQLATSTTMRTGEIIGQVRNQSRTSGIQDNLPKVAARKRGIQRARTDSDDCKPPENPTNVQSIAIPHSYSIYEAVSGREPDEWLLADSGYDQEIKGRIFIFGRKSYEQWMGMVSKIYADGTFKISPPLFEQVFVVLAKRDGFVFPIATGLLPNKLAVTYRRFFQLLHSVFPNLSPDAISCDFELAIQTAARSEWEEIDIDGCYWHLCSNLYKHLQQEGLSSRYDSDAQFAHECRKIVALACVPKKKLDECFEALKKNLPDVLDPVLHWFEQFYLGPMQADGERKTARFPIDSWNLVKRIQKGDDRTDNYAEAHHRKVACELGVSHPNFYKFVDSMKTVQRGIDEVFYEMVVGHDPPIKRRKYRMADMRMKALVTKAVEKWQQIVPMDYLSGIASNFRMAQGPYIIPGTETINNDQEDLEDNEAAAYLNGIKKDESAKVVVSRFSIELTDEDMCRLEPGKLINDNIIDYYLQLIAYRSKQNLHLPKVVAFDTKFYVKLSLSGVGSVLGWTRHEDIFKHDILLVPIYLPGHWALVAVKIKKQRLIYYDSLLGDGHKFLSLIKQYLQQESMRRGHEAIDPVNWLGFNDKTIPQQINSYDCGVFVCLFAESVSREVRSEFEQNQLEEIRRRIAKEILDGVLSEQNEIDETNV